MIKFSIPVNGEGKNLYFVNDLLDGAQSGLYRADSSEHFNGFAQVTQIASYELTQNDLRELIQNATRALEEKNDQVSRSRRVVYIKPGVHGDGLETAKKRITKKDLERQIAQKQQEIIDKLEKRVEELKAQLAAKTENHES